MENLIQSHKFKDYFWSQSKFLWEKCTLQVAQNMRMLYINCLISLSGALCIAKWGSDMI